ncbi:unnamed protein product [Clonostachys rosea f. rosea IK726]|uniref:Uncharacterized protein n=1 Tax=Clonostachys rosea f. rosea IK726 TaxID=1349383 RepID=A0ACA9UIC1_BIOOC|nr:unnamed protein product [Clonostachys rosea f. rosea IK726]
MSAVGKSATKVKMKQEIIRAGVASMYRTWISPEFQTVRLGLGSPSDLRYERESFGRPLGVLLQEVDAEIWTRIHGTLYSDVNGDVDKTTKDHKIAIFRVEIDDWLASAPPTPIRTGPALSISATQDWYDLNYNETFIMLYRCQVTGYGDDMDHEVLRQCAQAAGSICLVYRRLYIGKTVNYT